MLSPASQKRHRKELLNEVLAVPYVSVTDHSMVSKRDLSSVDISSLNTKLRTRDQGDRFREGWNDPRLPGSLERQRLASRMVRGSWMS